jgi:hypothetical protein
MEEWKNTKCGNCVIQRQKPICNSCIGHHYYKPMTNAQKIRSMTDEELAKTLTDDIPCKMCEYWSKEISSCNAPFSFVCTKGYAEALYLKWLQSEAE